MSLTGEKGIHKFLYVLNNCFLFCSAEQVIKRTFVRANLDHTCACVLWSCEPKHANQPPIQEKLENDMEGAPKPRGSQPSPCGLEPRSWRPISLQPTPPAPSTRGPRRPVQCVRSVMPRQWTWGWRWRGVILSDLGWHRRLVPRCPPPPPPEPLPTHCPEAASCPYAARRWVRAPAACQPLRSEAGGRAT